MTTAYVDFTYYTGTFLGTAIASSDFSRLALRASAYIDQLTFDRAADETAADTVDKIKMATCAVAEQIQANEADGNADGIAAESVGSLSVTYSARSSKQKTNTAKLRDAASVYLGSTGLMYPGFADGEYSDADEL